MLDVGQPLLCHLFTILPRSKTTASTPYLTSSHAHAMGWGSRGVFGSYHPPSPPIGRDSQVYDSNFCEGERAIALTTQGKRLLAAKWYGVCRPRFGTPLS
jgi:hypothetical protein